MVEFVILWCLILFTFLSIQRSPNGLFCFQVAVDIPLICLLYFHTVLNADERENTIKLITVETLDLPSTPGASFGSRPPEPVLCDAYFLVSALIAAKPGALGDLIAHYICHGGVTGPKKDCCMQNIYGY